MGNVTRRETSFFNKKQEKLGENRKNRGKNTKKLERKKRKIQKIQKQDFNEISGNAENGNKILTRFREMLKTETRTKTRSSQMS